MYARILLAIGLCVSGCLGTVSGSPTDVLDSDTDWERPDGDDEGDPLGGDDVGPVVGDLDIPNDAERPKPMPRISAGVPAFASSGTASNANDANTNPFWLSNGMPAWLAYDLSGVAEEDRQVWLVAIYAPAAVDYAIDSPNSGHLLPIDYTVELNDAPGGTSPPSDDWRTVASVTDGHRSTHMHLVAAEGANWLRVRVTESSGGSAVGLDVDVHSANEGASDAWLFMGDSITFMNTPYVFSDLPRQVAERDSRRWPAIIPAAQGGTNTQTAQAIIDGFLDEFPGRFVVLAYGTNDHANEFQMEALVLRVLAAGKVPVIPHMPWSDSETTQEKGPVINQIIDDLRETYPEILPGPDLWTAFTGRTDLIPPGDVHPNGDGGAFLRAQWAATMVALGEDAL